MHGKIRRRLVSREVSAPARSRGPASTPLDEVRLWFGYSPDTPLEAKASVIVDARSISPRNLKRRYLLRRPPEISKAMRIGWNGGPKNLVVRNPDIMKLEKEWGDLYSPNVAVVQQEAAGSGRGDRGGQEEGGGMAAQLPQRHARRCTVYNVFNPEVDLEAIPRLWIESLEIEGPIDAWPPKGRTEMFFDGETGDRQAYIREIFARFLPRAYRRPVEPTEIDEVVSWVLKAQEANKLSGPEAVREGLRWCCARPAFLLLQEPAGERTSRGS